MVNRYICPNCGQAGSPVTRHSSSFIAELAVWVMCFFISQIFTYLIMLIAFGFSIWRQFSKTGSICKHCQHNGMIPIDTPKGQALFEQYADMQKSEPVDTTGY